MVTAFLASAFCIALYLNSLVKKNSAMSNSWSIQYIFYITGLLVQCNIPLYVCAMPTFANWSLIVEYFSFHCLTSVNNARTDNL